MAVSIVGEAAVRLRPNTEGFEGDAESGILGPLTGTAKKAAGLFAAAFAAEKVGEFLKDSVMQASDLSESASKVGVVFGQNSQQVLDFGTVAAHSLGISNQQALEATGTFGNLFRAIGLTTGTSADMSTKLVGLAGDLASFNNLDPTDVLDKLRSGLVGETEPLRDLGININDAALKQKALQLGLDASGPTLSAAVKAQAAYALILEQTSLAQGDFSRTGAGLANQTRIISAEFSDVKANVGAGFLPFVLLGAHAITGLLMPALLTGTSYMRDFGDAVSSASGYFSAGLTGSDVTGLATATSKLGESFQMLMLNAGTAANVAQGEWVTFTDAVKGGGVGVLATEPSLAGFLSRFGSGLHGLGENASSAFMSVRTSATTALAPLADELAPTWLSVKASIGSIFDTRGALAGSGAGFLGFINGLINQAAPIITGLIDKIAPMLATILPTIGNTFAALVPVVSSVFSQIVPLIGQVLPVIEQVAGLTRTLFLTALQALLPVLPPIVTTIGQLVTTLVGGLAPILSALAPLISQLINSAVGEFSAILKALVPVIPPLVSALGQVAQMLAGALLSVLQALMPIFPVIVTALTQVAQAVGQALISAITALAPVLPPLIQAFMSLVQAALTPLLPLLPVIASLIPPLVGVIVALVQAVAPFLPLIVQVVATLIQLAVLAIQPLMPIVSLLANLLVVLVQALMPIITAGLGLLDVFLRVGAAMIGAVVGAVSAVIGWFQKLLGAITGIASSVGHFLSGMFDGLGDAASAAFGAVTGAIKWALNGIIGIINGAIGFINRDLIGTINKIPGVDIPSIPLIPKLHEGGVFTAPGGEGLALLRNQELVVTPEQRSAADDLLRSLLNGTLAAPPAPAAGQDRPATQVTIPVTQLPGESGVALATRVSDQVVYQLNNGITATVGAGATP